MEVLHTLLLEVKAIVNSRPLTHVGVDVDSEQALTPFSFLIGTQSNDQQLREFSDGDLVRRVDWRKAQRLADHFWQRSVREYLPLLIPRQTVPAHQALDIGDVVFIADGNLPRNHWPLGRIVERFPGMDNVTPVVIIATKGGVLRRPGRKLVRLDI